MQKIYEARKFLSKPNNTFGVNRFSGDKNPAIVFVSDLYKKGAIEVFITGINNYISEDQMNADSVIVKLPDEKEKRSLLFDIYNRELIHEGFEPENDKGQKEIKIWYD